MHCYIRGCIPILKCVDNNDSAFVIKRISNIGLFCVTGVYTKLGCQLGIYAFTLTGMIGYERFTLPWRNYQQRTENVPSLWVKKYSYLKKKKTSKL